MIVQKKLEPKNNQNDNKLILWPLFQDNTGETTQVRQPTRDNPGETTQVSWHQTNQNMHQSLFQPSLSPTCLPLLDFLNFS